MLMNNPDNINPLWKLASSYTVSQAAAIVAGVEPNSIVYGDNGQPTYSKIPLCEESNSPFESIDDDIREAKDHILTWVQTAFSALINSINDNTLNAQLKYDAFPRYVGGLDNLYYNDDKKIVTEPISDEEYLVTPVPNWKVTFVTRADLKQWLENNGITTGFLFQNAGDDTPDYLNPKHPRYAKKLAATVTAWQSVTDPKGKSPKDVLKKWLREHAAEYDLTDDEGKPQETVIEELGKVANWSKGGAPTTPEKINLPTP